MKFLMFDFDGVIVSSFSLAYHVMQELGVAPATEDQYRDFFKGNVFKKAGTIVGGETERVITLTPFFKLYGPELLKKRPVLGMVDLFKELNAAGYSMVIISSTMDRILEDFLTEYGIRECFTKIYGSTYHKDKVFKIERALEDEQATASEAVFITDTLGDLHDAEECRVPAIAVTWGYHPAETLKQGNPKAVVNTVKELRQQLLGS